MTIDRTAIIRNLAEPLAASLGIELWGIEVSGASRPVLRLYVEKLKDADTPETEESPVKAVAKKNKVVSKNENASQYDVAFEDEGVLDEDERALEEELELNDEGTGVSIEQCAKLSRMLGLTLDVEGPFAAAWTLEVSSPGLERVFFKLSQMPPYIGREMELTLLDGHPTWPVAEGIPGRRKFRGTLEAVSETAFTLRIPAESRKQDDPEHVEILWPSVRRVNLVHIFPEPGLPGKSKADKVEPKAAPQEPQARRGRSRGPRKPGGGNA